MTCRVEHASSWPGGSVKSSYLEDGTHCPSSLSISLTLSLSVGSLPLILH